MITCKSSRQLTLNGFHMPFGGKLNPENRWVKLSEIIPWDDFARIYYRRMSSRTGRPCKDARLVIGAMLIKHKLNLSNEETVQQIQENPYLQFFVGLSSFTGEQPFAPSLFVEIRKRMGVDVFRDFENVLLTQPGKPVVNPEKDHFGRILMDATVCEQMIRYPTDLSLQNQAREISVKLLDALHRQDPANKDTRKPRTYRNRARKEYLRRNFSHIEKLLDAVGCPPFPLKYRLQRQYGIIQLLYHQQEKMYKKKERHCEDRIVSVSHPHVRPIVRGKAGKSNEFGAKIRVTADGFAFVDRIGRDAFSESTDLKSQVVRYRNRFGYLPEAVLADQLYGTRDNRRFLKELGVRFGGKALGRPPKETEANRQELKRRRQQYREDSRNRIPIERKFGQGTNGYRLNAIRARLQKTSEALINGIFLVMNLMVLLKIRRNPLTFFCVFTCWLSWMKKLEDFICQFFLSTCLPGISLRRAL